MGGDGSLIQCNWRSGEGKNQSDSVVVVVVEGKSGGPLLACEEEKFSFSLGEELSNLHSLHSPRYTPTSPGLILLLSLNLLLPPVAPLS